MAATAKRRQANTSPRAISLRGISRGGSLALYRTMVRIRRAQEGLIQEYHPADEMRCPIHFCVGQESPPAGVCLNLRAEDYLFTGHRSHGYYLAKGGSLPGLIAELYGKATGSNGGKAGHQEISDESVNFYSGTILVGTLAIAAGAALACQMRGESRVTVAVFGDGGADQGIVYETFNFAALKRLPMVFICENNLYSTYSRQSSRQAVCDIAGRARAFGLPARRISGNDVGAVFRSAGRAIARARKGLGPSLLELETYRWCGHVGPEDDDHLRYRSASELNEWKERCPIEALASTLSTAGLLDGEEIEAIEHQVRHEMEDAFRFAKSSPFPEPDSLLKDVFADGSRRNVVPVIEILDQLFDVDQPEAVPRPY